MTATATRRHIETHRKSRTALVLAIAAVLAFVVGVGSLAGGIFGVWYTYDQAVAQDVTTPDDAVIPETSVRGPLTMWAQSDIITKHQLESTDGLYYSQMERIVPQFDDAGEPVLDENGEAVMVPNPGRATWITATSLTTALGLGIISYALSGFAVAIGITLMVVGYTFFHIRKRALIL